MPWPQMNSGFQAVIQDPAARVEKAAVRCYRQGLGRLREYAADRAIIPTSYEMFENESKKQEYVSAMYIHDKMKHGACTCTVKSQFCEVMGNKYCSRCIELKNRNFGYTYENQMYGSPRNSQENDKKLVFSENVEMFC